MRSEPRQLKELRNLMPWTWDTNVDTHPPGLLLCLLASLYLTCVDSVSTHGLPCRCGCYARLPGL